MFQIVGMLSSDYSADSPVGTLNVLEFHCISDFLTPSTEVMFSLSSYLFVCQFVYY